MRISLKEAGAMLLEAKSIVITAHVNPDGDAIGSCLGMMHYLRGIGKDVRVLIDDEIPKNFFILPGASDISRPLELGSEQEAVDILLVLDANLERVGTVKEKVSAKLVLNIDHHVTNDLSCQAVYLDSDSAATAEIIYQLLKEMQAEITKEIAMAVYTGIATDTGFFRFPSTTPFTMRAAAELMECGAEPGSISEAVEAKPFARIVQMARAVERAELFYDGKVAGIFLDHAAAEKFDSTEGLIDALRAVEESDISLLLKWKDEKVFRVSMRSKNTDVSRIAAGFSGGGHERAAGCTLRMTFEEAKRTILEAIGKALEKNNGNGFS